MARSKTPSDIVASGSRPAQGTVARRDFMKSAAVAGAALAPAGVVGASPTTGVETAARVSAVPIVTQRAETTPPSDDPVLTQETSGSDFMIDVMKTLDIPYVFANVAATFRGLHESVINHGGNTNPEFITCVHEEQSAAMAHVGRRRRLALGGLALALLARTILLVRTTHDSIELVYR